MYNNEPILCDMEQDDFKKQIDELFRLLNKMMKQHPLEDIPGINQFQLEQMRMFLKNYDTIKDQLSYEMMGQMNEPMRQMIQLFIKQLRQELGETVDFPETEEKVIQPPANLQQIDERLRQPGLEQDEIDQLLDERARLVREAEQQKPDSDNVIYL